MQVHFTQSQSVLFSNVRYNGQKNCYKGNDIKLTNSRYFKVYIEFCKSYNINYNYACHINNMLKNLFTLFLHNVLQGCILIGRCIQCLVVAH